ncbi:hypothetical protein TNCV_311191 [Trichonephila clavipes]|nr:hypothetical protein TNCV_311191 [Trichonephila clavipes]
MDEPQVTTLNEDRCLAVTSKRSRPVSSAICSQKGVMRIEFVFMDDNARLHQANIVNECLQFEFITPRRMASILPRLESRTACVAQA